MIKNYDSFPIGDFPLPVCVVNESFSIRGYNSDFSDFLQEEKVLKIFLDPFDFDTAKSIQNAVMDLISEPKRKKIYLNLRLEKDDSHTLSHQGVLIKLSEDDFALVILDLPETYSESKTFKKNYLAQLEQLKSEHAEGQELISTFKYLMNAFPQNSIQFDNSGDYTVIRDTDQKIFSSENNRTGVFWKDINEDITNLIKAMLKESQKKRKLITREISFFDEQKNLSWLSINILFGDIFNLLTYSEVTEKKNELEQMIEQERLSTIGVLSGGLAHQYNNLHHAVLAQLYEASELTKNDQVKQHLMKASMMLEEGASLSSSLLSHLRNVKTDTEVSHLSEIFKRVEILVKDQITIYNCKLEIDVDDTLVDCNISEIDQVFVNLIINAAQACFYKDEDSLIKIHSKINKDKTVDIFITDNGCGIEKDKIKLLFTPLFSTKGVYASPGSNDAKLKGTGLGLNLAKKICERHHGNLRLMSSSEQGSIFKISLPIYQELKAGSIPKVKKAPEKDLKLSKVIIIDDSSENRNLLKIYLKDHVDEFFEFRNGKEPLSSLIKINPDLIFLDWLMPEAGGEYFLTALEEDKKLSKFMKKTIILSGLDSDTSIDKRKNSVKGVLNKPIPKKKLIESLKDIT